MGLVSLMDHTWADARGDLFPNQDVEASVPAIWVNIIAPIIATTSGFAKDVGGVDGDVFNACRQW